MTSECLQNLLCLVLVLTFQLSPLQNMPNVRDHDASVYLRLQGDALSVGGYEQNPIFWDEVTMVDAALRQRGLAGSG